jgi:hypothetical protein
VRAWRAGTAEPSTWAATATDSTAGLQQAGSVGIRSLNTATGSAVAIKYDDLLALAM